jgi:membrane protease YdiL (CAAX protease family)
MEHSLQLMPKDTIFFVTILVVSGGFMAYYFMSKSEKLKNSFIQKFGKEKTLIRWVVFERLLGVLFFGIIPLATLPVFFEKGIASYGISSDNLLTSLYWVLGLSPLLITMNYFNCKKEDNLAMYPQIRVNEWDTRLLLLSAFSWTAYLLAYEFMFRGYLLFVSVQYLGVWPAIALNIAIYALVHVPKGIKEAIGALPLGVVLGIITIQTGNIWVAFVVHIVLALSNEWFSLRAHPEMKFTRN